MTNCLNTPYPWMLSDKEQSKKSPAEAYACMPAASPNQSRDFPLKVGVPGSTSICTWCQMCLDLRTWQDIKL